LRLAYISGSVAEPGPEPQEAASCILLEPEPVKLPNVLNI
jgi:hypothetical protein